MSDTNDVMNAEESQFKTHSIHDILDAQLNVAEILDQDRLDVISEQVINDYDTDRESMHDWLESTEQAIKLASQLIESKTEPWPGAANVKHALILEACIQFASRALPEFLRDGKIVKSRTYGKDVERDKAMRADRIEQFMNFELMERIVGWEEGFDKLLSTLAMVGTMFKKTYYCPVARKNKSDVCMPDKVTINQSVNSLEEARRITHEIELYPSQIQERIRVGAFLDVELSEECDVAQPDNDKPNILLEQHRFLDLDNDGYPEPYIVTVHETERKVLRITPCFDLEDVLIETTDSEDFVVQHIQKRQYFSDFHFIRAIDGGYFSYGFGYLLSHATHTINTLLNQIIDAGTLDNLQSGFIGKGARVKGGQVEFKPGKWIKSDASGTDLRNSIVPLPTKGPSQTLLSLVQFLLQSYYRMISISDIMSGQISGSNTTAAEAMQAVEQGMKVMNAIHKRVYRGLKKELQNLYLLNRDYLSQEEYEIVLDDDLADVDEDFESLSMDIVPIADPSRSSQLEELMNLRMAAELVQTIPEIDRRELGRRVLTAMRLENVDALLPPVDPNEPTPQQQQMAEELQRQADELDAKNRELAVKEGELQLKVFKAQYEIAKLAADAEYTLAKADKEESSIALEGFLAQIKQLDATAKYIQAITPDNGASKDDNSGADS